MKPKKIEESHFKKLIGQWSTEGRILETDTSPEIRINGTDTYEIILDGFFILHKADVSMGTERSKTYELIGLDKSTEAIVLSHYNNKGEQGTMTGVIEGDELNILGDTFKFKGHFINDGKEIMGTWEKPDTQKRWVPFMVITLKRST